MPQAIFITGAGAGIGAETARLFARQGWIVGASDLGAAGLQALRREIGGDRLHYYRPGEPRDLARALRAALAAGSSPPLLRTWAMRAEAIASFLAEVHASEHPR